MLTWWRYNDYSTKLINQSNDAPPNISDTNYLDTDATVGLVQAKMQR